MPCLLSDIYYKGLKCFNICLQLTYILKEFPRKTSQHYLEVVRMNDNRKYEKAEGG